MVSKLVQSETILDHFKSKSAIRWPISSKKWKKLTMSLAKWFCKNSRSTAMVRMKDLLSLWPLLALLMSSQQKNAVQVHRGAVSKGAQEDQKLSGGSWVLRNHHWWRKYLCVPGTSTQAERVFAWMGWLLNKRRLSMSGETVSRQLFLKDNLVLWTFVSFWLLYLNLAFW